ncbi:unnamed protein product [Cochlearia groenlandica]
MCPSEDRRVHDGGFWTPPPSWHSKKRAHVAMPMSERKRRTCFTEKQEPFHMIHKYPCFDSHYIRAKHAQLISKDPNRAISLFWAAINAGDRVDSALKDMAVVMKTLNRSDEGIEAIKSFRYLCSFESQDSIDNLLLELYKESGRIKEEAVLLEHKLKTLEQGPHYGGRNTVAKTSHGKQINMTIEQEKARILGNLASVHLQLHNYGIAEQYYRNALSLDPDNKKLCNLATCLVRMDRIPEAKSLLEDVRRRSLGSQWEEEQAVIADMIAEREHAIVAENPGGLMRSISSDNFSSSCSFANWMKENHALAGTAAESGNMYKKKSRDSFGTVEQNSPVPITHPQESKCSGERVDHKTGKARLGASQRLRFGKPVEVQHHEDKSLTSVESEFSTTNRKPLQEEKADAEIIGVLDSDYELHPCMTRKARKMCEDSVEGQEVAEEYQRCVCISGSSSAYAQIMDTNRRSV